MNKNKNTLTGIMLGILISVCFVLFAISFLEISWIPKWSDIFGKEYVFNSDDEDSISFLNVGQGDAILIKSNGRFGLIDTGTDADVGKNIARAVKKSGGKELDALLLTHYHNDHYGGLPGVVEHIRVNNLILPTVSDKESADVKIVENIIFSNTENVYSVCYSVQSMIINIGDFEITVIFCPNSNVNENDNSVIAIAKCHDKKILLMSDAENSEEIDIIETGFNTDCDIIKIAHHGSDSSSSFDFLKSASPEYAVISCGKKNMYGHPHSLVLERLQDLNVKVFRTDINGDVSFIIDENGISVKTDK